METLTPQDEYFMWLDGVIERCGWAVQYVYGSGQDPPWAYTIGLADNCSHPEFIVVGLDPESSQEGLNDLGSRVVGGERFHDLATPDVSVLGLPARLVPVHRNHWNDRRIEWFAAWLGYYRALGRKPAREALQVVWSEPAGCFPGDPGFPARLRGLQPQLGRPSVVRGGRRPPPMRR